MNGRRVGRGQARECWHVLPSMHDIVGVCSDSKGEKSCRRLCRNGKSMEMEMERNHMVVRNAVQPARRAQVDELSNVKLLVYFEGHQICRYGYHFKSVDPDQLWTQTNSHKGQIRAQDNLS